VNNMIGKKFSISGMAIEIISDQDDKWQTRNLTTNETVLFDKVMLEKAIRFGKAEEITEQES
jgi:hypothetical protein